MLSRSNDDLPYEFMNWNSNKLLQNYLYMPFFLALRKQYQQIRTKDQANRSKSRTRQPEKHMPG